MNIQLFVNIIVIGCVGLFLLILITVRCYLSCRRNRSDRSSIGSINELYAPQIEVKQQQLQWITQSQQKIRNQQCSICLDKNVNVLTNCNHTFHLNCIIEWKKRMKSLCPYCKGSNLNKIIFYCHKCKIANFEYIFQMPMNEQKVHMVPKFFLQLSSAQNPKRLYCPSCKVKQSRSVNQEIITKNFSSIHASPIQSNKVSRDRKPVEIQLISNANYTDAVRTSQHMSCQQQQNGPITGERLLIKINY